jgi:hypothetical protein
MSSVTTIRTGKENLIWMKSTYDFIIQIFMEERLPLNSDEVKMTSNIKIGRMK